MRYLKYLKENSEYDKVKELRSHITPILSYFQEYGSIDIKYFEHGGFYTGELLEDRHGGGGLYRCGRRDVLYGCDLRYKMVFFSGFEVGLNWNKMDAIEVKNSLNHLVQELNIWSIGFTTNLDLVTFYFLERDGRNINFKPMMDAIKDNNCRGILITIPEKY